MEAAVTEEDDLTLEVLNLSAPTFTFFGLAACSVLFLSNCSLISGGEGLIISPHLFRFIFVNKNFVDILYSFQMRQLVYGQSFAALRNGFIPFAIFFQLSAVMSFIS